MNQDDFVISRVRKKLEHIRAVQSMLCECSKRLFQRAIEHDSSKFEAGEWVDYLNYSTQLSKFTFGSEEHKQALVELEPMFQSHFRNSRHHPEHHEYMCAMNLFDLLEMVCDWIVANKSHENGDVMKYIEINQEQFGYGDELREILINTIKDLGEQT